MLNKKLRSEEILTAFDAIIVSTYFLSRQVSELIIICTSY